MTLEDGAPPRDGPVVVISLPTPASLEDELELERIAGILRRRILEANPRARVVIRRH